MKTPTLPALMLALSSICISCDSTTGEASSSCGDPSFRIREVSFVLNGIRYSDSTLFPFAIGISTTRSLNEVRLKFEWPGPLPGTLRDFYLDVSWPRYQSGVYSWGDRFLDSSAYGCTIYFDSTTSTTTFESISGSTSILLVRGAEHDSIFGTFCGTMKNDRGEVVVVSDGRFANLR